jgi:cyclopropane fatty-acyl-phospholipid synthase-like methyltransferase
MTVSQYYDDMAPDEWAPILGLRLNFHFGYYTNSMTFEEGLETATEKLIPHLAVGRHILDLGCGWGGPALRLREQGFDVECATNSTRQTDYCVSLGLKTYLLDAESYNIESLGCFDSVLMLESLEHICDKQRLLFRLTRIADRLVLVSNCLSITAISPAQAFADTMTMVSSSRLLDMIEDAGWRIQTADDYRHASLPTLAHWRFRIESAYPRIRKLPIQVLYELCRVGLQDSNSFERDFPLMFIVADRK